MPKKKSRHNYPKETAYENRPEQVKRRVARNRARAKAIKKYGRKALVGKEIDHLGSNRHGDLNKRKTRIVSKRANRSRQPKRS